MFYQQPWDPLLIVSQIIALQCGFYLITGAAALVTTTVLLEPLGLEMLLTPANINLHTRSGWCPVIALVLAAPACSLLLYKIVNRAKEVLDFTCTCYLIHICCCWIYSELPTSLDWWLVNAVTCVGTVLLAEYMCIQREMRDIILGETPEELAAGTPSKPRGRWFWGSVFKLQF
eukprot:gb/GEZN01020262.1/.p2 GENE.gb/GEZN01020262.1/~~gb/GEZN01020262.1/.p2  ORF type:complete len:174 (+),score=15.85 gb/GEZN01020262.1/:75-596(+)